MVRKRLIKDKQLSTKLTPNHSFLESGEGYVCQRKLEKKKKQSPQFKIGGSDGKAVNFFLEVIQ